MSTNMNELVRIRMRARPNFTGTFGRFRYEDGVSEPMTRKAAEKLSASMAVDFVDAKSLMQRKARDQEDAIGALSDTTADTAMRLMDVLENPELVRAELDRPRAEAASVPRSNYSREQLEEIADREGIAGLRAIGDLLDVRAKGIAPLIDGILAAQNG